MGLWEQIVNGKVRKCKSATVISANSLDSLSASEDFANELKNGKIIYSKDYLTFENNKGSYFLKKTPFIGFGENGTFLYEEVDKVSAKPPYTIRIGIDKDSYYGTLMCSFGTDFDINNVYLIIDLQFS